MVEGTLIRMVTDSQKHNKKLKTELDEVKRELETYKKSQKVKEEICPYFPNSTKIYTITIFRPTSMLNIKDNKKSKCQRNKKLNQ